MNIRKIKSMIQGVLSISVADAFAEINEKYSKAGALLKAVRLRENLSQKDFAL